MLSSPNTHQPCTTTAPTQMAVSQYTVRITWVGFARFSLQNAKNRCCCIWQRCTLNGQYSRAAYLILQCHCIQWNRTQIRRHKKAVPHIISENTVSCRHAHKMFKCNTGIYVMFKTYMEKSDTQIEDDCYLNGQKYCTCEKDLGACSKS